METIQLSQKEGIGNYLVDSEGMTLYYFTKDMPGKSNCSGGCLEAWPIFYAEEIVVPSGLMAEDFGSITREDGQMQTTYKGWPLYHFFQDEASGDTNGDGANDIWYVAKIPFYTTMLQYKEGIGNYLIGPKGMTLYYFTKDMPGKSNCTGDCLEAWPIFYAEEIVVPSGLMAEDFGTITREDGQMQTTYKGWPLYYFFQDEASGDTNGDGANDVWYVAKIPFYTTMLQYKEGIGNYLVDSAGMTLYYFDRDRPGKSNCVAGCLEAWPIFYIEEIVVPSGLMAEDFDTITRQDGDNQTTYQEWPLYYFIDDNMSGDTSGDGVNGVWHVLVPATFEPSAGVAEDTGGNAGY
jgi:predicted lipoprotein with Yx(FWY)xxD motif